MKKFFYLSLVVFSFVFIPRGEAQVKVNININSQPLWGPVGYDYVQYYYLPEIDSYYNVDTRKYTYWHGKKWVTKSKLPSRYRHVDLYRTYKVVVNSRDPWRRHEVDRNRYRSYRSNHTQVVIRDVHKGGKGKKKPKHGRDHNRGREDYGRGNRR